MKVVFIAYNLSILYHDFQERKSIEGLVLMLITYVLLYHDFQERKSIEGSVFSAYNLCVFIPRYPWKTNYSIAYKTTTIFKETESLRSERINHILVGYVA